MNALLIALAISLSPSAFAAKQSSQEFRAQLEGQVKAFNSYGTTKEWIEKAPGLSFAERAVMRKDDTLPATPPAMKVDFEGGKIKVQVDTLTVDLSDLREKKQIHVKDVTLTVLPQDSIFQLAGKIAQLTARRKNQSSWNLWNLLVPDACAEIDDTCLGRYEFMHRSPYLIFDTPAGYLPHLAIANLALTLSRQASTYARNCPAQVSELNELLKAQKIGLKEITCGTTDGSSSSNQVDLEFWTPESDGGESLKSRTFSLDYSLGMAQEDPKNSDDDATDDAAKGKKKKKSKKPKKEALIYIFSPSKLQEVRTTEEVNGEQECIYIKPKASTPALSEKFAKTRTEIEPFRKIFEYFGNHDTCMACKKEVRLKVRNPAVPAHLAEFVKASGKPLVTGDAPAKKDDEEEDTGTTATSTDTDTTTVPAK